MSVAQKRFDRHWIVYMGFMQHTLRSWVFVDIWNDWWLSYENGWGSIFWHGGFEWPKLNRMLSCVLSASPNHHLSLQCERNLTLSCSIIATFFVFSILFFIYVPSPLPALITRWFLIPHNDTRTVYLTHKGSYPFCDWYICKDSLWHRSARKIIS